MNSDDDPQDVIEVRCFFFYSCSIQPPVPNSVIFNSLKNILIYVKATVLFPICHSHAMYFHVAWIDTHGTYQTWILCNVLT